MLPEATGHVLFTEGRGASVWAYVPGGALGQAPVSRQERDGSWFAESPRRAKTAWPQPGSR